MSLEATSADVVKIVQQYLKENGYSQTLSTFQEESTIYLNSVENQQGFLEDIRKGHWDRVLRVVRTLKLPQTTLEDLYEQVTLELLEMHELETARALLRRTKTMALMRQEKPERYLRLEHLLTRSKLDARELFGSDLSRDQRRENIARLIQEELVEVPGARLLTMLGQALKWQKEHDELPAGDEIDLFAGKAVEYRELETYPTVRGSTITFVDESHAECAVFSPDGKRLVTGSVDGFIEVWDPSSGRLALDLEYQTEAEGRFMMHEDPVLCLCFSGDGKLLVSGCQGGRIMIWQVEKGKCLREFARAHTAGVTSVVVDGTQVLSTSFDNTLRIHGIQSGKTLKIFRGHTSYVQRAILLQLLVEPSDASSTRCALSASSDGTLRLWDVKTTDTLRVMQIGSQTVAITQIAPHPVRQDTFLVCNRSQALQLINARAQILASFQLPTDTKAIIQCMAFSPKARWLYAGTDDGYLYCWDASTGRVEHIMRLHSKEVIGLAHHPTRNMLASWAEDGTVQMWRTPRQKSKRKHSEISSSSSYSSSNSSAPSGGSHLAFKLNS
eukprot:CAMPEP_0174242438 /NCGR_PEP_ID=MMETSP0417-20130205/27905_1 /TAXON_ID=242541 /ORGANISM="Mayorella sp, Strain BSH-02190019" /LENGTH=555 /DNA_ID=CAMNT_0015321833 /DNA_START=284 /DNA_END=1951 /DNA_ORIENTATION=-